MIMTLSSSCSACVRPTTTPRVTRQSHAHYHHHVIHHHHHATVRCLSMSSVRQTNTNLTSTASASILNNTNSSNRVTSQKRPLHLWTSCVRPNAEQSSQKKSGPEVWLQRVNEELIVRAWGKDIRSVGLGNRSIGLGNDDDNARGEATTSSATRMPNSTGDSDSIYTDNNNDTSERNLSYIQLGRYRGPPKQLVTVGLHAAGYHAQSLRSCLWPRGIHFVQVDMVQSVEELQMLRDKTRKRMMNRKSSGSTSSRARRHMSESQINSLTSSSNALLLLTDNLIATITSHQGDRERSGGSGLFRMRYEDLVQLEDVRVTASEAEIRSLNIECINKNHKQFGCSCSVCLSDFALGDSVVKLPRCGHHYHYDCISRWLLEYKDTCPTCRKKVFEEQ